MRRPWFLALCVLTVLAGCGGDLGGGGKVARLTTVVSAPFSRSPYVAETIARGVELGALDSGQVAAGKAGFNVGGTTYELRVLQLDSGLSPRQALRNVRRAVAEKAIAIVDEGTGVDATWSIARRAGIPIGIVYQGGTGLVDPERRPNVFRIAPTDHGVAFRLAEYLIPKGLKIALLYDDTGYGQQGARALDEAFSRNREAVATRLLLPSGQSDLAPQILRARRAGATALIVWARGPTIANALAAARSRNWSVPVYTPPAGADPVVRQQLADHPEWVDGLTFAGGRLTAEVGGTAFEVFATRYRDAYGPDRVGVETRAGVAVTQPPEYAMYPYDFVRLLVAAIRSVEGPQDRDAVLSAMNEVTVAGANGDERAFNRRNHDGVVDDDVYFARFRDMVFRPVKDDPLSATLPAIDQLQ